MDEFELTRRILDDRGDDPAALERVRGRLRERIDEERRGSRPPTRWRRVLPIAAALGLLVALLVSVVLPTGGEAAAAELRRLGAIASTQQELRPGPGQFLLIRSEELRREGFTFIGPEVSFDRITRLSISTWVTPDGSAFRHEDVLSSDFASEADRQAWIDAGKPDYELPRNHTFPPGQSPLHDVSGLPADPDRLLAALRSGEVAERPPGDDQVFILIGELLAQGDAPPEVRAALFEVAARLEEVKLVGAVEDPLGRPGIGISIASPPGTSRLVFATDSAQLLAIELYESVPGGGERLDSWIASLPTTVVDEAPRLEG